ncbi:hypothetical protein NECAME_11100 [Necator americanus]|uniref:Uncharacterized protein n=1 Tax=Necator americanus TaxID=51031 RepID=W2T6W7_NECAM|nr:hypothetical protein NECAME_11100 [Necator americanus]ETN77374.1 hypothetical protein NECAME_11100 [Necator americanus]
MYEQEEGNGSWENVETTQEVSGEGNASARDDGENRDVEVWTAPSSPTNERSNYKPRFKTSSRRILYRVDINSFDVPPKCCGVR